jgi:hypothetical protein
MSAERSEHFFKGSFTRREVNQGLASAGLALFSGVALGKRSLQMDAGPSLPADEWMHARAWSAESTDESTHVLGNGRAMVHELGPNILYFRAPWISAPSLLTMNLATAGIHTVSSRARGSLIWQHTVYSGAQKVGTILDFLDGEMPVLRRAIRCDVELGFLVRSPRLVAYADRYAAYGALLGQWPYGSTIYGDFKSSDPFTLEILYTKGVRAEAQTAGESGRTGHHDTRDAMQETLLRVPAGSAELLIVGEQNFEHCLDTADRAIAKSTQVALDETRALWKKKLSSVRVPQNEQTSALPVADVVDDVATLLLGHQSREGSVAAGQYYPLFYVRDQYGVSRALLAMGMTEEAKGILAFYYRIWRERGRIHNAQSDGPRLWFHRAENDDVEMTGYLIVQAFDYLRASGDEAFVAEILPMLQWALEVEEAQLFAQMLPFNGDETYVAGGVFPRTHLTDGSSEATLLYVAAAERLLQWVEMRKLWSPEKVSGHKGRAAKVKAAYAENFVADGKIAVNRPRVPDPKVLPRFRYGVCLGHYDENCLFLSDTEIAEDGRYFCMSCYPKRTRAMYEARRSFIPSVGLTSVLLDYAIVSDAVMERTTADAVAVFAQDGRFAWPKRTLPGYETAVVVMALKHRKDARAQAFLRQMLALRDATGAWVEYYENGEPKGCRARPWESALSVAALLDAVKTA